MDHWIDHLVLAVPALDAGIALVEAVTGVAPAPGGVHPGVGTHNALLSLGAPTYLEVIAPDPEQAGHPSVEDPPLMPRLVAFAVGCADLDATVAMLRIVGHDVTDPFAMTRRRPDGAELAWRAAMIGGRVGGAHPFLISWDGGTSPAVDSPLGGRFVALRAGDPDAAQEAALLATLDLDVPVEDAGAAWLLATIDTGNGLVTQG